jgi:uncharacterized protein (UPF0548 family)
VPVSTRLRPFEADRLREAPLTYDEVGATDGRLPDGYHHLTQVTVVGRGREVFEWAAPYLMGWAVQRRAGLRVATSSAVAEPGAVAVLRLGVGPLALRAPVRVVHVVDEPDRRGFAYGTLRGHPESGEELFVLELAPDGEVTLRITAFSRPRSLLARAVGPLGRLVQRGITRRYARAFSR